MNRFQKTKRFSSTLSNILPVAVFLVMIGLFLIGVSSISRVTTQQESDALRNNILRSAVHCYAMEGFYPETVTYLEEHYGLEYNKHKYAVVYEIVGSNLMPDVTIIPIEQ